MLLVRIDFQAPKRGKIIDLVTRDECQLIPWMTQTVESYGHFWKSRSPMRIIELVGIKLRCLERCVQTWIYVVRALLFNYSELSTFETSPYTIFASRIMV